MYRNLVFSKSIAVLFRFNNMRFGPSCLRPLVLVCSAGLLLLIGGASFAWAEGGEWPTFPGFSRGPGGYLAWPKLLLLWLLFLFWVKTTDWVNRDVQLVGMSYAVWNVSTFIPFFIVLMVLGLGLPLFAIGFALCIFAAVLPVGIYVLQRNARVEPQQKVMTPDHIRFLIARMFGRADEGSYEKKAAHEQGAQVDLTGSGSRDAQKNQSNTVLSRQMPGYVAAKELVAGAIENRAEKAMLDYTRQAVSLRYQVDGVWHDGDEQDLEAATASLEVLKVLSNMDPNQRRARQEGGFEAKYEGEDFTGSIVCQGTKTGERVIIHLSGIGQPFNSLADLGMREAMVVRYKELMLSDNGILLLSTVPSGGLTTLLNMSLRSTDRYLRDFVIVEGVDDPHEEIENVSPLTYNLASGETPDKILPNVLRKEPDVVVMPELHNKETVKILCEAAVEDQMVIATIRAKEAVEALLRVLLLKVSAKSFAPVVAGVLNQRLIRKLCETCKEAYAPPPALLKKLGIPAGHVEELYRHPEQPEEVCPDCRGIGYKGRTAVFELLIVDDQIREALIKQPKLETLRKVARQSGQRSLQEEGILAVAQGVTSLPELMRVLKQ